VDYAGAFLLPPLLWAEKHTPFAGQRISINVKIAESQILIEKLASLF